LGRSDDLLHRAYIRHEGIAVNTTNACPDLTRLVLRQSLIESLIIAIAEAQAGYWSRLQHWPHQNGPDYSPRARRPHRPE
jgi:hypothetical protein